MDNRTRAPKGKMYAILDWLDMSQAANYLSELTEIRLHYPDMMGLCTSDALSAYMDFSELQVEVLSDDADAPVSYAIGKGRGKLEMPMMRNHRDRSWVCATGPVTLSRNGEDVAEARFRLATSEHNAPVLCFRRRDIQTLAVEMHPPQERSIHARERIGIEQVIAVLADMAKVDLSSPYAADEVLRAHAATERLLLPDSPETVTKHLKAAAKRIENDRKMPSP